jgi:uncharacterized protein (DUF1330 family)
LEERGENAITAYVIFLRDAPPHDPDGLAAYQAMNRESVPTFLTYGIKPLAVYGKTDTLEGAAPDGAVILEFPSAQQARAWYDSPEYQAALPHRLNASEYRAFIIEGL